MSKPLLQYPLHPEFEELLNSCGSMTRQLESMGQKLTVSLVQEMIIGDTRWRIITLNLNHIPVIVAASRCLLSDQFFSRLLENASITPIGKFLFAVNAGISRDPQMNVNQVIIDQVTIPILASYLFNHGYQSDQPFWCRPSLFHYQQEQLFLTEIILPEVELFY